MLNFIFFLSLLWSVRALCSLEIKYTSVDWSFLLFFRTWTVDRVRFRNLAWVLYMTDLARFEIRFAYSLLSCEVAVLWKTHPLPRTKYFAHYSSLVSVVYGWLSRKTTFLRGRGGLLAVVSLLIPLLHSSVRRWWPSIWSISILYLLPTNVLPTWIVWAPSFSDPSHCFNLSIIWSWGNWWWGQIFRKQTRFILLGRVTGRLWSVAVKRFLLLSVWALLLLPSRASFLVFKQIALPSR